MPLFGAARLRARAKEPERPRLGPLVPVIDAILEADKAAPPKQRHTAKRIFERLRIEHSFAGGYTVVKDYVRLARTRAREMFVPLAHPPGHAQVVFGECIGAIGGVRTKLHVFCFVPFEEWMSVFQSQRLTGALLDRLTYHVHILELSGESYRLKQSKARRRREVRPADPEAGKNISAS